MLKICENIPEAGLDAWVKYELWKPLEKKVKVILKLGRKTQYTYHECGLHDECLDRACRI